MCTAIWDVKGRPLVGRTLDLEYSLDEGVVLTPRNYPMEYLYEGRDSSHLAVLGVATVKNGIPLYYDAMNEYGLCALGLNFPKYCRYGRALEGAKNIASFEVIPMILSRCKSVDEAENLLSGATITDDSFSEELPATPLHWMVADRKRCITVENGDRGLIIYENPVGVLTNSPDFPYHLTRLADYRGLCPTTPENKLSDHSPEVYSRGMGSIGLPGDYSSSSRFVRAVFVKSHTSRTFEPVSRFFHVMDSVKVPLGCIKCDSGKDVSTVYTSCADPEGGIYYYTTYGSRGIHGVAFDRELISESEIKIYPLSHKESIELS